MRGRAMPKLRRKSLSMMRSTRVSKGMVMAAELPVGLPWVQAALSDALARTRGHALLIHGPRGVGQFERAQALAATTKAAVRAACRCCR